MDARCRIELLGGLRVLQGGRTVTRFRTEKTGALLGYLAYYLDRRHPRETLIELLWPGEELDAGRHKLSVALSSLRQEFEPPGVPDGAVLVTDRVLVSLNPAAVTTDVAEFEGLLRPAGDQTANADDPAQRLARAVELYRGRLLPGYYEEWIPGQQQRLHQVYMEALRRLMAHHEQAGELARAIENALCMVAADPPCEDAHREVMRLYAAAGQLSAALRQYRQLEKILEDELGDRPTATTQTLVREIEALRHEGKSPPLRAGNRIEDCRLRIANCSGGRRVEGQSGPVSARSAGSEQSAISNFQSPFSNLPSRRESAGGAVPLDSPFYVMRSADAEFAAALKQGDSIVLVKGARQVGKTSLLARGLQQARESGARVVQTDFQTLNEPHLESVETLFLALGSAIGDQLDLDVLPADVWEPRRGANPNFRRYIRREVLSKLEAPVVWGLDEVDRLFSCPFGGEVFALFRAWHNERALDPDGPWRRFTLAIAYATEAHLFITDLNQSPFNVGTRLTLNDFTFEQVADLNQRYGEPLRDPSELARFFRLVGGHPYLVRRGLDEMARHPQPGGSQIVALEAQADQDDGVFGDHLRRLRISLDHDPVLRAAAVEVIEGRPCPSPESFYRLRSAGLITGASDGDARPRCQLYATYLKRRLR